MEQVQSAVHVIALLNDFRFAVLDSRYFFKSRIENDVAVGKKTDKFFFYLSMMLTEDLSFWIEYQHDKSKKKYKCFNRLK